VLPVRCYKETLTRRDGDPSHPFPLPTITSSFFTPSSVSASCLINLARADLACAHTLQPPSAKNSQPCSMDKSDRNVACVQYSPRGAVGFPVKRALGFIRSNVQRCSTLSLFFVSSKCTGKQPLAPLARQIPDVQYRQGPLP
jgi:hypothetical protein